MQTRPRVLASTIASIIITALPVVGPDSAHADLMWDPANANNTWVNDGTTKNWLDGTTAAAWSNNQLAIFGGTSETVTINSAGGVIASGLRFDSDGYTIAGTGANGTLTLGAGGIAVTNASDIATISAPIAGTAGLIKTGAGILTLGGANTFSGGLILNAGSTRLAAASTFTGGITINAGATLDMTTAGADSTAYNNFHGAGANALTFDGGTYRLNAITTGTVDRTITGRNIVVNGGGATFDTIGTLNNFQEGSIYNQLRFAAPTSSTFAITGTGTLTKNGGGRLTFSSVNATGFSGPVVMNDGTWEVAGSALGNASATNTITVNGGHLALTGDAAQKITLNGGGLGATGGSRTITGSVDVATASYIFTNDFWRDFDSANTTANIARNVTIRGMLTGSADIGVAVNRAGYRFNSGSLVLSNPANSYSGTITVGKNLRLENNPTDGVGKTLGTAAVVLADGGLVLRDNGVGNNTALDYGTNVSVIAPSDIYDRGTLSGSAFIDANRPATGGTNTGNTFKLGALKIGRSLTIQGGNDYGVEFAGASQLTGNAILNVTTAPLTFTGTLGQDAAGRSLTKTGTGVLSIRGDASYSGPTVIGQGTLAVSGTAGKLSGSTAITVNAGGTLHIDNSAANLAGRVLDATPITLTEGGLIFSSLTGTAVAGAETVGTLTLADGANTITVNRGNAGAASVLTVGSLVRLNNATVKVSGSNFGEAGNSSRLVIADRTTDSPFLGAWITVNNEFARYIASSDANGVRGVAAVQSLANPANDSGFSATEHLKISTNTTTSLTADRSLNTVNFANTADGATLALGANSLTLASGGILVGTNAASITASTGALTSGTPELLITNNAALNIGAAIRNNGATPLALIKTGPGTLTLSGQNAFTGDILVNEGTLAVSGVSNSGTAGNLGSGGTVRLSTGNVPASLQFTGASDATNRPLVIGAPGANVNVTTGSATLTWNGEVSGSTLTTNGAGTLLLGGLTNLDRILLTTSSKLSLGGSATLGSAAVTGSSTLSVGGMTTITGDLDVGNGSNGTLTGLTGGTLVVGAGSTSTINIGAETIPSTAATTGTANLANLDNFIANVGIIRIGVEGPGGVNGGVNKGTLILPATSTIKATDSILVGDSPGDGGGTGVEGTLTFGSGINDVTTPNLTIGGRKYDALSTIASGGTLLLGNPSARTALNVGANTADTGTAPVSTFDLTGGTIGANLSSLTVGLKNGGGAAGRVTGSLNLGASAQTDVNISATSGSAIRIGIYDFSAGAQPTSGQANGTMTIGNGNLTVSSTVTTSSAVVIGNFTNSTAISTASATNSASGILTIDGGNVTINSAGTANAINLGARSVAANTVGTNTSSGTLNLNGGTLTVNNQITGNSGTTGSTSTVNITGGTLNMQGKNISNINNLTFSGGTIRNLGTLNQALTQTGETSLLDVVANNTTISGAYSVTDGDVNIATGRTLGTSGTTLNGTATLNVDGSLTGSLLVNAGATVTGKGTTQALTLAGGILAPGNSAGILNTGNLTLSGGTLSLEINGATAGTGYDQINVTGTVSLTANTAFTLTLGFTPAANSTFVLINNDGTDAISGAGRLVFGGVTLNEGATFTTGGTSFRISYAGGTNNNDVVVQAVPEPGTALALFGAVGTLLGLQRFRRRSR